MIEVLFAASLLFAGVILIVVNVTYAVLPWTGPTEPSPPWAWILQSVLGVAMVVVGVLRIAATLWKVGASAERRKAIVARAGEIELLNEVRRQTEDLPSVPVIRKLPQRGQRLKYRLLGSKRGTWGLIGAIGLALLLASIVTTVAITAFNSLNTETTDWLAFGILACLIPATVWSIYRFIRQLLKLSGLGPTQIEISDHPVIPGKPYQLCIAQPGRLRLSVLDVLLICEEEATFHQGTDIRTERKSVFQQRLFRKRGIAVKPNEPFQSEFELQLPEGTMHSFKSANNRVQWKIVVHARAKGWPEFERDFVISVHPSIAAQNPAA